MSQTINYFCYGSNLLSDRIHVRLKGATRVSQGILDDYTLVFSGYSNLWKGATANIIQHQRGKVYGIIWSITYKDLEQLSIQERGYRLIAINVRVDQHNDDQGQDQEDDPKTVECITYVQTNEEINKGKEILGSQDGIPSLVYKEVIIKGAVEQKLPESYIEIIKSFQAKPYDDCELAYLVGKSG